MSWEQLTGPADDAPAASALESARFGLAVQRLTITMTSQATDADVAAAAVATEADLVVVRYPADRVGLFHLLGVPDRTAIFADALVYWRLVTGAGRRPGVDPELTVGTRPEMTGMEVEEVTADIFRGYRNHYAANPRLDAEAALRGYAEWARRSVAEREPVVVRRDGTPIALATLDRGDRALEIELAGVRTKDQGRGVYPHLLAGVEDEASRSGAPEVVISTQVHNTGVQRAWARYGFEPVGSFVTVHLVRDPATPLS